MQHAVEVDAEHPVPILARHVPDPVAAESAAHAGVVAQHVNAAPAIECLVGEPFHFGLVHHVRAHADRRPAARLD
jgi:hypothetical protein